MNALTGDMLRKQEIEERLLTPTYEIKEHVPVRSSGLPIHWDIHPMGRDSIATIWESKELTEVIVEFLELRRMVEGPVAS